MRHRARRYKLSHLLAIDEQSIEVQEIVLLQIRIAYLYIRVWFELFETFPTDFLLQPDFINRFIQAIFRSKH